MNKYAKRTLIFALAALLLAATIGAAAAQPRGNPKGEITDINEADGELTILTTDGEITVLLPENFDFDSIEKGMFVVVKGDWLSDTEIEADWVKPADEEDLEPEEIEEPEDTEETDQQEEGASDSPWCSGQKETVHPVVAKIAEKYGQKTGISEEQVHEWFCEGNSVGQIMLALTTQIIDGSDPGETLADRNGGKGWGQIWKEKKLIGNEREGYPPGWANKLNKNKDKPVPPGLLKKTKQAETP